MKLAIRVCPCSSVSEVSINEQYRLPGFSNEERMCTVAKKSARIQFLAPTRDDHGRTTHHPGEIITGELMARNHDFLLVRAHTGAWMYLDTTRTDLYSIEMHDSA